MSLSHKIFTAMTYNMFRIMISIICSVIYSIVVVRWLKIHNFGGYAFLDSIFSTLYIICLLGTHPPVLRYVPELLSKGDYPRVRSLLGRLQKINIISSLVTTVVVLLMIGFILGALGKPELEFYSRLIALGFLPSAILGITKNILVSVYEQKFLAIFESFLSFFQLILLVIFVVIFDLGLTGAIMVPLVSNTTAAIVYSLYVRVKHSNLFKGERSHLDLNYTKRVAKYAAPLVGLDLISSFTSYANNTFLGVLKNLDDVAYFDIPNTFAIRISSLISGVIGSVGLVSLTEVTQLKEGKLGYALQQYVKIISLYVFPATVGGVILAEPLLVSFYGESIIPSVQIFQIILTAQSILNLIAMSGVILNVKEKTHIILLGGVTRSIIITVLSLWLIPSLGINGAVISSVASSAIVAGAYAYLVAFKIKIGNFIPVRSVGKYLIASLAMGLVVATLFYLLHTHRLILLTTSLLVGLITYGLALRIIKAFDKDDRAMIKRINLPFKSLLLMFFWKE